MLCAFAATRDVIICLCKVHRKPEYDCVGPYRNECTQTLTVFAEIRVSGKRVINCITKKKARSSGVVNFSVPKDYTLQLYNTKCKVCDH